MSFKILISGGGTGGHIYPGISLANEFKKRNHKNEILFIGTKKGMEAKIIPHEGFKFETIIAKGIKRQFCLDSFKAILIFFVSLAQSYKKIRKYRPDIVIGTGGYVSGAIVLMASILNIPVFIHEQNVIPGITNKFLSFFANATFLSFEQSRKYFKSKNRLIVFGNPIRLKKSVTINKRNYHKYNLNSSKKTILVIGGSKGAASINRAVFDGIKLIKDFIKENWQVLLVSGTDDYDKINSKIARDRDIFYVEKYLYDIGNAYVLADLIICRGGATTLAELNSFGKAAIIVPYPYATNNHQELNARVFENKGAAIVITEKELSGEYLSKKLKDLLQNNDKLNTMAEKSKKMEKKDSAKNIVNFILNHLKEK